ncbi:matrixin [Salinirubellus salinus]|uniref:Matrixin n=1 Tax=Salinirubellus salinus TaxID=1364945 RepID=A0A9E7R026_9EURY|nr:matrixin [Salinirubellus salinus]UWM53189.1 matrixin [Salinirubellus salinus]
MRRLAPVVLCATLVVLAGCSTGLPGGPTGLAGTPGDDTDPVSTPTPRPTLAPGESPFPDRPLVVSVSNEVNQSRDFEPLVAETLAYWEANAEQYAGYEVDYRLDPDATDPDFSVRFVAGIDECGSERGHPAGCAPVVEKRGQFDPPHDVRIQGGFSDASTLAVLKHEFGHTLGLRHDDAPAEVMRAESVLTTLPRTDAVNESYAWNGSELSVYVDLGATPQRDRDELNRQVDETLAYFERGAGETVADDVSFVRTQNRTAADVVIQVGGETPCERDRGSCRYVGGLDPDGDGRLETFERLEVYVLGLEPEAVGWHVGRHVGYGLSLNTEDEYPEPLQTDASFGERRSDWWESG